MAISLSTVDDILDEIRQINVRKAELVQYSRETREFISRETRKVEWQLAYLRESLQTLLREDDRRSVKTTRGTVSIRTTPSWEYDLTSLIQFAQEKDIPEILSVTPNRTIIQSLVRDGLLVDGLKLIERETVNVSLREDNHSGRSAPTESSNRRSFWSEIVSTKED